MEDLIEIYTFYNDFLQTSEQKKNILILILNNTKNIRIYLNFLKKLK